MISSKHEVRRLLWDGCCNVRDLGDLPAAGGKRVRWGAVVRSDDLSALSEAGRESLEEHGVRTIVDLRTPGELIAHPPPYANVEVHRGHITYLHRPFLADEDMNPDLPDANLGEEYLYMLESQPGHVRAIIQAVAEARPGGVLIHCAAGKDRTGIITALLLDLVGVSRDVIAEDYALSSEWLRPRTQQWLESGPGARASREAEMKRYWSRAEMMDLMLRLLEERHGGVAAYLRAIGVSDESMQQLRDRLLADK